MIKYCVLQISCKSVAICNSKVTLYLIGEAPIFRFQVTVAESFIPSKGELVSKAIKYGWI
jgi:hypothetical protein